MNDPFRSYFGHPVLPAGFNSWDIAGDEVDGAGVNEPIWPVYTDTFEGLLVLLITHQAIEAFATECPDYVVPSVPDTVVFPREVEEQPIAKESSEYAVLGVAETITLPQEVEELDLKKRAA